LASILGPATDAALKRGAHYFTDDRNPGVEVLRWTTGTDPEHYELVGEGWRRNGNEWRRVR